MASSETWQDVFKTLPGFAPVVVNPLTGVPLNTVPSTVLSAVTSSNEVCTSVRGLYVRAHVIESRQHTVHTTRDDIPAKQSNGDSFYAGGGGER